jgi:hypothetical protein
MKIALASTVFAAMLVAAPVFSQEPPSDIPPNAKTRVTVDTTIKDKEDSTVKTINKEFTPVSGRPAIDPNRPIAPEVLAVVNRGKRYTTKDLVNAQLEAMLATPASKPTTNVTTTITTPRDPG